MVPIAVLEIQTAGGSTELLFFKDALRIAKQGSGFLLSKRLRQRAK